MGTEPFFFQGSLFENVKFGCDREADFKMGRVLEICKKLGIPQQIMDYISDGMDGEVLPWADILSYTQKCLVCLARALIANAEVMCIHKPTMAHDEKTSRSIMELLRSFCLDKGVLIEGERHLRRPRTCIITSCKAMGVQIADEVYVVSANEGFRRVEADDVREEMLG